MRRFHLAILCLLLGTGVTGAEELPVPSYNNAVIISIEHPVTDSAEVDYIKSRFDFGLYTWLSFSWTSAKPDLDWHASWDMADSGIQSFKKNVNRFIQAAKEKNVKLHIVLGAGLNRGPFIYKEAKQEDVRNCQWYNDNKIASDSQILDADPMREYVWSTLSRYSRKMRSNLEAKARAALAFLKRKMDEEPDVLYILSGWAETELNAYRIMQSQSVQDHFCDYSPFAVLEFRDWIGHTGMYENVTGLYKEEGYPGGGSKYQGADGLARFNQDFGTNFSTWDLKYYHWSLADNHDTDPTDAVNNDPNRIPIGSYSHGNMMPTSGPDYLSGGFDPPRVMRPGENFWELWSLFRETMVHHGVVDLAKWAAEAGIPAERWYSHQIPGDYLFGTNPDSVDKNPRYYTSASPLWTADIQPFGSPGATIYDLKLPPDVYPGEFARTSTFGLAAIEDMSENWAIMEYDAETYPPDFEVAQSNSGDIFDQYLNVYGHRPHVVNFWRWWDETEEHRIKGMNKEKALGRFIQKIRDKARRTDLAVVFDPPRVTGFSGGHNQSSGENSLVIDGKIWNGFHWEWKDWGDFDHFEIFRSETPDFPLDESSLLAETGEYAYSDSSSRKNTTYYYRMRAVNSKGIAGPASLSLKLPRDRVVILNLNAEKGGTTDPAPGLYSLDSGVSVAITAIPDEMNLFSGWSGNGTGTENPFTMLMDGDKNITAHFSEANLYPPLNFQARKVSNSSLVQVEYINDLTWEANPRNHDIVSYRVYEQKDGVLQLITELDLTIRRYFHRGVEQGREYTYVLAVVDSQGYEGPPSLVTVS